MTPVPRLRAYSGPALLSYGFRPFFLFGAIYAGLAVLAWLPMLYGELQVSSAFAPVDWHVHEMLYGYVPAVVTGFLLTAIPNWTGRLPIQGMPLLVLVAVWLAGRVGVTLSAQIGWLPAAIVDAGFLALVIAATAREIVAGKNWRNLRVVGMVVLLFAGNIAFHVEAHVHGHAEYGVRIGIAATVLLLVVIGGRIIPSAATLALWVAQPSGRLTAAALIVAAVLNIVRLARWAGDRIWRDRLVLILHVGYLFVPFGFLLAGLGALDLVVASAGIHAWMVGAAGSMTLAVMTRASLGHTGNALVAWPATQAVYAAVVIAALARICSSLEPGWSEWLLPISAFAWAAAFLGFAVTFGPLLLRPKPGAPQQ